MHIEIDQSIKIEYTSQKTILAFSNGHSHAIVIPPRVKRTCIEHLRKRRIGPPRRQVRLFAAALFLLLEDHIDRITTVTIDREYKGHDVLIKDYLLNQFWRAGYSVEPDQIRFGNIGKKSAAHHVAIDTFRGKRKADKVVSVEELLSLI